MPKANSHLVRKFLSSEIFLENLGDSTIEASGYIDSEDHAEVSAQFNFSYINAIRQYKARSSS